MGKWSKRNINELSIYYLAVFMLWVKTILVYVFGFHLKVHSFFEWLLLLINPIGIIALILGMAFFFSDHLKSKVILALHFVLSFILYGNLLYYRFFSDFITVPVLFQFQNVGGLSQSTLELMNWLDLLFLADVMILFVIIFRKNMIRKKITRREKQPILIVSILMIVLTISASFIHEKHLFQKPYDRELLVKSIGNFNYHLFDILLSSKMSVQSAIASSDEITEIKHYLDQKQKKLEPNKLQGIAKGKNIFVISLESLQEFVINREIDGKEMTPFLNQLIKESYYFPNFYHQTAQGKTSDAEFMIDNGLYPLSGGSVFVRRPQNEFYSLPHILSEKGYYSAVFHSNTGTFWNREVMYESLGYDRFFSDKDYDVTEENSVNYGLKDIPFVEQSIPYLQKLPKPFYAKMLTLTNHFPFILEEEDQVRASLDSNSNLVERYAATVSYTDEAMKIFFGKIKEAGLYEDSIFILYGDHYGVSKNYYKELSTFLETEITPAENVHLQKVPLIIHIPGQKGEFIPTTGGQTDIRRTILHLLGVEPKKDLIDFGEDLFMKGRKELVVFRDGSFVTDQYIFTENLCFDKETDEQIETDYCQPYFDDVQKELYYSDSIIYGDLLRFLR